MGVSKRTRQKEMKKNLIAVAIILAFAVTVFSINSIGRFIADKIIRPVAEFSGVKTENASTQTVKTKKLEAYLVSFNEYSSLDEANSHRTEAKEQGASGYVFEMDGKFNIIHSIHTEKASAEELAENFSSVLTLTLDELSIKITGTKKQVETVTDCFNIMTENALSLTDLTKKLEKGEITALQVSSKINAMKKELENKLESLNTLNSNNVTVKALTDMLSISKTLLSEMPTSDSSEFSQKLKYVACAYTCEYFKFYGELE